MIRGRLDLARWLLDAGAGASARSVLGDLRGAEANRLRLAARASALGARVYGLGTLEDARGVVIPLDPAPGRSGARDEEFRAACEIAIGLARGALGAPRLPSLRFELEDFVAGFGASLGLGAAIAFVAHYVRRDLRPERPVLATGLLRPDGRVEGVDRLAEKLAAAREEVAQGAILLVPAPGAPGAIEVGTLGDALAAVFGAEPLAADPSLLALDEILHRSRAEPDHERALALLESLPLDSLEPADAARAALEMGTRHRHAGRSGEAMRLHSSALAWLVQARPVVGAEAAERWEIEGWLTALDEFRVEEVVGAARERLSRPFLLLRNEVRCRGLLAQALGIAGRAREAVEVRRANLPLHQGEDWLRRVLPGTHCYLALDSARAGDSASFDRFARELGRATLPGDDHQWRYGAAAIVRGLVHLSRHAEALAWVRGEPIAALERAPASVLSVWAATDPIESHPESSLARALVRAHRRVGAPGAAIDLARRIAPFDGRANDLVAWLAQVARLEGALALRDAGREEGSARAIADARAALQRAHPAATRFHEDLVACPPPKLEAAVDRVWY